MSRSISIALTIFLSCVIIPCRAQRIISSIQRAKIDSLKIKLQTATNESKADCLNQLSFEFAHFDSDSNHHSNYWNPDTARLFAISALRVSENIHYNKGMGDALVNLGLVASDSDFVHGEKYIRQAIPIYEEVHAEKELARSYTALGWYLYGQSRFEESRFYEQKALDYMIRTQNQSKMALLYRMIGYNWSMQGHIEKEFEFMSKNDSINRLSKRKDPNNAINTPLVMGNLYETSGDHNKALLYFREAAEYQANYNRFPEQIFESLAETFAKMHQYDSANYYYRRAREAYHTGNFNIGEVYLSQSEYARALPYFFEYLEIKKRQHDNNQVLFTLKKIATIYDSLNQFNNSLRYVRPLLALSASTGARRFIKEGYQLAWWAYYHLGKIDSAYVNYLLYSSMKDSLKDDEFIKNIAVYEMKNKQEQQQANLNLLKKDNNLKESLINRQVLIRNFFIGVLLISLLATAIILRYINLTRKKEKLQKQMEVAQLQLEEKAAEHHLAELAKEKTQLEMKVLRTQMNPHFIFNSLNSINRFILQNNKGQASQYLTKFSKLVRLILQNSQEDLITLESELESLELYLDLEALRFNYHFSYKISIHNDVEVSDIKVPPLIIQPYVENAIWHGLMHKEEKGQLDIDISEEDNKLICRVTDNGIGRKKAEELGSKSATRHKSMGLHITADRIALIQKEEDLGPAVKILDLTNADGSAAGTEIMITLPLIYA
jgi:sensor histidine kinase YesM